MNELVEFEGHNGNYPNKQVGGDQCQSLALKLMLNNEGNALIIVRNVVGTLRENICLMTSRKWLHSALWGKRC